MKKLKLQMQLTLDGFVANLIREKLIDELHLFINPVAIGEGLRIFTGRSGFKLIETIHCENGMIVNQYEPI